MKLHSAPLLALLIGVQTAAVSSLSAELEAGSGFARKATSQDVPTSLVCDSEVRLKPDGINTEPGWALDQISEKFSTNTPSPVYSYPDTTTPVRLYLIDTAVTDPGLPSADYPNLKSLEINSLAGQPIPRDHGNKLLSLIAGKNTGIAVGTPIHVVNYDIYSESAANADPTTDVSSLIEAISEAVEHSKLQTVPMRSVICIATSSSDLGQRYAIDESINSALAAGIPVVISAGNLGLDAAGFTPPSNGVKNGVICVGASHENGVKIDGSNFGAPVDILAPGFEVDTRVGANPLMTGTSPATALVAGAVLVKLSASPTFTPAGIESSLKLAAQVMPQGPPVLRSVVAPSPEFAAPDVVPDGLLAGATNPVPLSPTSANSANLPPIAAAALQSSSVNSASAAVVSPGLDSDGDGVADIVETFHGMQNGNLPSPAISLDANRQIQFKFPIDQSLLDGAVSGNTFVLRNGYSWKISCTSNFSSWDVPVGSLSKTTDEQGQAWLIASFPAGNQPSCFARIEIVVPPPAQ